jgi:hypothetical protein
VGSGDLIDQDAAQLEKVEPHPNSKVMKTWILFTGIALSLFGLAGCQSEQTTPDEIKAASAHIAPATGPGDPPPDAPRKGPKGVGAPQ